MRELPDRLLQLTGPLLYAAVGLLVFAEDALFVGFVLPGETAAILGGVAASLGHVSLPVIMLVVVIASMVGDTVGYEVGRRLGPRLLRTRPLRGHEERLQRARERLATRGGPAVFTARFIAFFRAVMPALAGSAHMLYRRFLIYNAAGGIVWGAGTVLLGYLAGHSYAAVERTVGRTVALIVTGLAVAGVLLWRIRGRRKEHQRSHEADGVRSREARPNGSD